MFLLPRRQKGSGELNDGITGRILFQTSALPKRTGARGPNNHLWCASRKRVASQRRDLWIFHAKPVNTVNDQQYTILFIAAAVYFRQCLSDPGRWAAARRCWSAPR